MKHARKMIMVPYIPQRPDRENEQLSEFDTQMSKILSNQNLSVNEKVLRYNDILNKYIEKNNTIENNLKYRPIINEEANLLSDKSFKNEKLNFDLETDEDSDSSNYLNDDLSLEDPAIKFLKPLKESKITKRKINQNILNLSPLKTRKMRNDTNARSVTLLWPINEARRETNSFKPFTFNTSFESNDEFATPTKDEKQIGKKISFSDLIASTKLSNISNSKIDTLNNRHKSANDENNTNSTELTKKSNSEIKPTTENHKFEWDPFRKSNLLPRS